ncbi:MAG TPA: hypothetical protein VFI47_23345 [Acidimicrobiales bacterium]|nr:hypothetical protein [Acidimicrobiales bacterium]
MDEHEARAVLGVADGDGWHEVRAAYRVLIRSSHPDTAGAGATTTAARLNEAYAVLGRARRAAGAAARSPAARSAPPPPPAPPPVGVAVVGGDTLLLAAPPGVAFALLIEAGHEVGEISYVDRSCAIFEAVVRQDGETCSLVVTVTPRAHGSEALCTLEAMERAASLAPDRVVARLVDALG